MTFSEWLTQQLKERGWSIRELSRRSGLSHANISKVKRGKLAPSRDFCAAIACGLEIQAAEVMQAAGYEDVLFEPYDKILYEIAEQARELTPAQRKHVLALMRMLRDGSFQYIVKSEEGEA